METNRDTILRAASNGNSQALEFLRVFARRAHWVDDLRDRDKLDAGANYSAPKMAEMEAEWLLCLSGNPFFLAHLAQLVPAMVLALNAWVDSERGALLAASVPPTESEIRKFAVRDVLKGQWHEVVWLVAWLTGGWEALRATSGRFRSYDFEPAAPVSHGNCDYCGNALTTQCFRHRDLKFCNIGCQDSHRQKNGMRCAQCDKPIGEGGPYHTYRDPLACFCSLECINKKYPKTEGKELNGLVR